MKYVYHQLAIMKFCEQCNNKLQAEYDRYQIVFRCPKCEIVYKSNPQDTLIMSESDAATESRKVDIYTRYAHIDKTITLVKRKCPSITCKSEIAKQLFIGNQEIVMFICNECNTTFKLA
jgi:DNA-directed RNA polymerase subunit M/transcription elongation factor TFIIS